MKNRKAEWIALTVYMRYVFNSVAKWNLGLALVVPPLNIFALVSFIPSSTSQLTPLLVSWTSFLYSVFTIVAAYAFASDLSRGTYTVFLSQPLTRRGYVITWMLAIAVAPATAYLLSFLIPFVVMDIRLFTSFDPVDFLLLFLEGTFLSMVMFLAGLISKRPQLVAVVGVFMHMVLFTILGIVYSLTYHFGRSFELIALIYATVYPFKSKVFQLTSQYAGITSWAAFANLVLSIALVAAAIEYSKGKFEVT